MCVCCVTAMRQVPQSKDFSFIIGYVRAAFDLRLDP